MGFIPPFLRQRKKEPFEPFETIDAIVPPPPEEIDDFGGLELPRVAQDSYIDHLAGIPQRPKVGVGRNILAALASGIMGATGGVGKGLDIGNQIKYGGFERELGDWKQKGAALKEAAAQENARGDDFTRLQAVASQAERRREQTKNDSLTQQLKERDLIMREERNEQLHTESMRRIEAMEDENARRVERDREIARHSRETEGIGRERNIISRMNLDWKKAYQSQELQNRNDPKVAPYAQKSIREMAKEKLGQDPEFAPYYTVSPQGIRMFDLKGIKDPVEKARVAKKLKAKLARVEADTISKRYSDYFRFDEIEGETTDGEIPDDLDIGGDY